jgi:hypothetical protein
MGMEFLWSMKGVVMLGRVETVCVAGMPWNVITAKEQENLRTSRYPSLLRWKERRSEMNKKKQGKRFLPQFCPTYIEVIAVDDEGRSYRLQVVHPGILYSANMIRVYVKKLC